MNASGKSPRLSHRRTKLIGAVAVALLFVLSAAVPSLLSAAASASPSATFNEGAALAAAGEPTVASLDARAAAAEASAPYAPLLSGVTPASVERATAALLGPFASVAAAAPPSLWAFIASLPTNSSNVSKLQAANGAVDGLITGIGVGDLFLIAVLCGVTVGLGCAVALGAIAIVVVALFLLGAFCSWWAWGCSSAPNYSKQVDNLAVVLLSDTGYAADVLAQGVHNELQALNLTTTALSYEASAEALSQISNGTFNEGLALSQGGGNNSVAVQLMSVFTADSTTMYAGIFARALAEFSSEEGTGNTYPVYCPMTISGTFADWVDVPYGAAAAGSSVGPLTSCPVTTPSGWYWAQGTVMGVLGQETGQGNAHSPSSSCVEDLVVKGSTLDFTALAAGGVVNFWPVNGAPEISLTVPSVGPSGAATDAADNLTWAGPTEGYWICVSSSTSPTTTSLYGNGIWPLNATSATGGSSAPFLLNPAPSFLWDMYGGPHTEFAASSAPSSGDEVFGGSEVFLAAEGTSPYVASDEGFTVSLEGGNSNATSYNASTSEKAVGYAAQANLETYLWHLESYAGSVAGAYYAFLRAQGYTSESQIPPDCFIPTPSQLLPPNVPPSVLEAMNTTTLLTLYLTTLTALGEDFLTNLTVATFCNHPLHGTDGFGLGFGTFALGYVYVPFYSKSSDGKVTQVYATPSTWNWSGLLYIAPASGNYSIPIGQRWLLGQGSPATFIVEPFMKMPKDGSYPVVNRTGPTYCASLVTLGNGGTTYGFSASNGCNYTASNDVVSGLVAGNSTLVGGSAYPTYENPTATTANISVYLTGCFVSAGGSSADEPSYTFNLTGSCDFSSANISNTGITCNGDVAYQHGQEIGSCATPPPVLVLTLSTCGGTIPVVSEIVDYIAPYLSFLGPLACGVAWLLGLVMLVMLVVTAVVLVYAFIAAVRVVARAGRDD